MSVCYTGVGALETGNHTTAEFLNVMDTHFGKECPRYVKGLKCKSCKRLKQLFNKEAKALKLAQGKEVVMSKKHQREEKKQSRLCNKCRNTTRKCNLKSYLKFSGAIKGKCKN